MTAQLLIGSVLILLLLAAFLWPLIRPRAIRKPHAVKEPPAFSEEYAEEFIDPPVQHRLDPIPELPRSYGIDRMVLMVRDPYWLYAYWEITATKLEEITSRYGTGVWEASRAVLRVYDVTGVDFNGTNANSFFDCSLNEFADSWHVNVPESNRTYCVDMGRLFPDGTFITLIRSNYVTTPRDNLSDNLDEEWMWIEGIYRTLRFQTGVSSPLIAGEISERMGDVPLGISSPGFYDPHG